MVAAAIAVAAAAAAAAIGKGTHWEACPPPMAGLASFVSIDKCQIAIAAGLQKQTEVYAI